jgi:aryl-alcohol dehydrogenase-like predicted oxidoreductase
MTPPVPRIELAPGYAISRILKGGWQLAGGHGAVDAPQALADMDAFVAAGITTFDCADIYTGVEALIGDWRRSRLTGRDGEAIQVHTKYVPDLDRLASHGRADVVRGVERSLRRLGVERLDVVQLHWWDYDVPGYVEAACWLDELRREGKLRLVGTTNFDRERLAQMLDAGASIASMQAQYSLLDRRPAAMAAWCADRGVRLLCYGAVAGGFLSERYLGAAEPQTPLENRSLVKYRLIIDECGGWARFQELLGVLDGIARRHAVGIGAVAIRWAMDQPCVAGVIVGARHARHLPITLQACTLALDDADRAAIARVQASFDGPSGEVYALERAKGGRHAGIMRYTLNRAGAVTPAAARTPATDH